MDRGSHFVSMEVWERDMNFKWEIIVVYGPTDHIRLAAFLAELHAKIASATLPVEKVAGGDFNLLCSTEEKSNSLVDLAEIRQFNDWIADLGLLELDRVGARFTWSNRQVSPTLGVLNHVFFSPN
nr:proline-rich protein 36-like [Triticum aestivum]